MKTVLRERSVDPKNSDVLFDILQEMWAASMSNRVESVNVSNDSAESIDVGVLREN